MSQNLVRFAPSPLTPWRDEAEKDRRLGFGFGRRNWSESEAMASELDETDAAREKSRREVEKCLSSLKRFGTPINEEEVSLKKLILVFV